MSPEVLYLDNHILAVGKPPGLLSQGDRTKDPSVLSLAKEYVKETFHKPGNVYLGLPHRLDRPASGVMVLARTSKAMRRLSEQFRKRRATKRYVALVEGCLRGEGWWEDRLLRGKTRMYVAASDEPGARTAVLECEVLTREEDLTLVDVRLVTGRRHQIRCQFAHRGFPLLGDMRYGARREFDGRNLALHGYGLAIDHPTRRERLSFEAQLPPSWDDPKWPAVERLLRRG